MRAVTFYLSQPGDGGPYDGLISGLSKGATIHSLVSYVLSHVCSKRVKTELTTTSIGLDLMSIYILLAEERVLPLRVWQCLL